MPTSRRIFSPDSSSTPIVLCGFQIKLALRGSPNFDFERLRDLAQAFDAR